MTGGILWQVGSAWNSTYHTCIADTVFTLDVLPEQAGPDAILLMQMKLSYHPARGEQPAGEYVLRYRIGGAGLPAYTSSGLLGVVDLPALPGAWTRLSLRLAEDIGGSGRGWSPPTTACGGCGWASLPDRAGR
ncbi:hypothetical protein [Actinoplanes sp. NBRC 103695]|uniref:hypothetical protein n=1 Tax=Actinoplanes sp. NBRC 103695 TaxID=3032202 RepID=UPI0024A5ACE4|nr:hypothetical protein [Actinoplanes sp. NBRC 103695]GLZ01812.1 hypothetical protein Acsp02_90630 [Actinoplanes sp. NBRC 103695]